MSLVEQILSIIFSFLYGIIIYFLYKKFFKYLYLVKKIYCFFNFILFLIDITLIYFLILYRINDGIINILFVFLTLFTFVLLNYIDLQKKCKNKSNRL